jgi:RNA polymerase-binding protein DksA
MPAESYDALREQLEKKKAELTIRLERITENLRRGYHPDSKERAKELEDSEVVDALGNEARAEIRNISAALQRMDAGEFGTCAECGIDIDHARIYAHPYAKLCIDCARLEEERSGRYS